MLRKAAVACLALVGLALLVLAIARPELAPGAPLGREWTAEAPRAAIDGPIRALILGTGLDPASTEVSIEQDVTLASEVLPSPKLLLFGGGRDAQTVVERAPTQAPSLRARLAAFFGAPVPPDSKYRRTRLAPDGPATPEQLLSVLERALAEGDGPLLVYWAGHGEQGEGPEANVARLWGGFPISPIDLEAALTTPPVRRSAQIVMTTCFSGGFAELVFEDADPGAGPSSRVHCGLFAAPWDDEASGCDPDPERSRQEGFGLHFLNALRGRDRDGRALAPGETDLDGDGAVSLLEAHARARVSSLGIEVPTTSSERFLRAAFDELGAEPAEARAAAVELLPEDAWVAERLGAELGARSLAEARDRVEALAAAMEELDVRLSEAELAADEAYYRLRIALLERWPALDDPWNPRFEADLERDALAIARALDRSPGGRIYAEALARVDSLGSELDSMRARRARAERLARAHENLELAAQLAASPSPLLERYEALLACERAAPIPLARRRGLRASAR